VIPRGAFRPLLQLAPALAEVIAAELDRRKDVPQSYQNYLRDQGLSFVAEANANPLGWIPDRPKQFLRPC
jgi:hypothetical protein